MRSIAVCLLACLMVWTAAPKAKRELVTEEQAQVYYDAVNETYFQNKLPAAHVHFVENLEFGGKPDMTLTEGPPFDISLSTEYQNNAAITFEEELHETCHIATWDKELDNHGEIWQNCMKRLANEDAFKGLW